MCVSLVSLWGANARRKRQHNSKRAAWEGDSGEFLVTYLTTSDTPNPEYVSQLPAVWGKDTDGGATQVIRL